MSGESELRSIQDERPICPGKLSELGGVGDEPDSAGRYPRRGIFPAVPPSRFAGKPIKVAIVYAVLYRFRMPIFRRLSEHPSLQIRLFVGKGVPGTKFSNAPDHDDLDTEILWTLQTPVNSSGRNVTLSANPSLPWRLARFKPDVLLIQGGLLPNNWFTWIFSRVTGTPVVWWSLGEVRGRQFRGLSALYRRFIKWVERRSTTFAGYSSVAIEYFLKQGYDRRRCFNLVNVVDTNLVAKQIEATRSSVPQLRTELGLDNTQVLLFVGSLSETKGLDILLHCVAELKAEYPAMRLLVVGDGPQRQNAEALAKDLGVADYCRFVGAVYQGVSAYFQLATVLVMPGTGGLAISEGMAHGLPVICSTGDGVEVDLIDEGENGYYVQPNCPSQLADRIRRVLDSPERASQMGSHSLRIIQERANIELYLNEMLSAIYAALDDRHLHRNE
ncbi:MAG: glycosyltransferase family 4 protein [Pirellulaceae bacterium]